MMQDYKKIVEDDLRKQLNIEFSQKKEELIQNLLQDFSSKKNIIEIEQKLREKLKNEYNQDLKKEISHKEKLIKVYIVKFLIYCFFY